MTRCLISYIPDLPLATGSRSPIRTKVSSERAAIRAKTAGRRYYSAGDVRTVSVDIAPADGQLRSQLMKIRINYSRIGDGISVYTENLVEDNGTRLKTFSVIPVEFGSPISEEWRQKGLIAQSQSIHSVTKYYFYTEYFDVLVFSDGNGELVGYYCDIVTPLEKIGNEYFLTDLFLDLWLTPDRTVWELDWDEFERAANAGLISTGLQEKARSTLKRLRDEIAKGTFPSAYID